MDKKRIANLCLTLGLGVFVVAAVFRLGILTNLFHLNIPDLWKLSLGLFAASIAASLCKE